MAIVSFWVSVDSASKEVRRTSKEQSDQPVDGGAGLVGGAHCFILFVLVRSH